MILVDAHVHIYDCFDLQIFFDSALANFQKEAVRNGQGNDFSAILLLTEAAKDNWFQRLVHYAVEEHETGSKAFGNWIFHRTNEICSLYARSGDDGDLFLVAGRQVVTAQRLEVLALATDKDFEEGAPLRDLIQDVRESGAIPAIPWGTGKWLGRRGEILENLLKSVKDSGLFLGDNGNRPSFWRRPSHFELAQTKGIRVLPGSDPLPFASEACRPGSFGFMVEESITPDKPAKGIRRILLNPATRPIAYGKLENTYRFFRNQMAMQILKRQNKQKPESSVHAGRKK